MRDALFPIEVVLVVRTKHGVGEPKRVGKLPVETPLGFGPPPAMRDADEPFRHAVADADLDLDTTGRTLDRDPFSFDDAGLGRRRGADEEHRLRLARPEFVSGDLY